MFDTTKQFEIAIQSGGRKTAVVRWPTDEEFAARAKARKIVRKTLGRGKTSTDTMGHAEADAELWKRIVIEAPEGIDEAEIGAFLARLTFTDALEVERHGGEITITLQVTDFTRGGDPVFVTRHTLRLPTQRQIRDYSLRSVSRVDQGRQQVITTKLEAGGELYDQLLVSVEGYGTGEAKLPTPLPHKDDVVMELLGATAVAEDDDPEA